MLINWDKSSLKFKTVIPQVGTPWQVYLGLYLGLCSTLVTAGSGGVCVCSCCGCCDCCAVAGAAIGVAGGAAIGTTCGAAVGIAGGIGGAFCGAFYGVSCGA